MYAISDTDPIILRGECRFVCAIGEDGKLLLRMHVQDADEMLAAATAPIEDAPGMGGVAKMFREKHVRNMTVDYGDVFDGLEFLEDVKSGCIMDYDGFMGPVIVDGYASNLGVFVPGVFDQGRFPVDAKMFAQLCNEYRIQVVWHGR